MRLTKAMSYGRKIRRPLGANTPDSWPEGWYWWPENGVWYCGDEYSRGLLSGYRIKESDMFASDWIVDGIKEKERPSWW